MTDDYDYIERALEQKQRMFERFDRRREMEASR